MPSCDSTPSPPTSPTTTSPPRSVRRKHRYYTEEEWLIPVNAITPFDMAHSQDFRRIGNGPVLVETQEPWGFPALLLAKP